MGGVREARDRGIRLQAQLVRSLDFHDSSPFMYRNTTFLFFPSQRILPQVADDPVFNYAFSANPLRDVVEAAGFIHRPRVEESGKHVLPHSACRLLCLSKRILREH
ncbi:hypothetical protein CDAR_76271 [Caerostris darwini]|uniref:Uncharacterized protein n=1 Tax=Caerostris darwini TaxID=1538125 RepID=A0AAV4PWW9_9ARAC|nr:hypothetical protein CDAR_76271 [Caerostris darwini]